MNTFNTLFDTAPATGTTPQEHEDVIGIILDAAKSKLAKLEQERKQIKDYINQLESKSNIWDLEVDFVSDIPPGTVANKTGIYFQLHKPTDKMKYTGQGNLRQRRATHKSIYKNNGNPIVFTDSKGNPTSSTDSPCARNMYQFDPQLRNWATRMIVVPKNIAKEAEKPLAQYFQTEFNDKKMLGKS